MGRYKKVVKSWTTLPTSSPQACAADSSTEPRPSAVDDASLPDVIIVDMLAQLEPLVEVFSETWRYDANDCSETRLLEPFR